MPAPSMWPEGLQWVVVIIALGLLIFFHELGHFIVALTQKVKVEEFGFGFPPRMLTLFEHKGVKYTLNWIPFGGFVRMAGDGIAGEGGLAVPEAAGPDGVIEQRAAPEPAEGTLPSKKPWQRILISAAGPGMNVVVAVALGIAVPLFIGIPQEPHGTLVLTDVMKGGPADQGGMQAGQTILQVNSTSPDSVSQFKAVLSESAGKPVTITVRCPVTLTTGACAKAPGQTVPLTVTLCQSYPAGSKVMIPSHCLMPSGTPIVLGVTYELTNAYYPYKQAGLFQSIGLGFTDTWNMFVLMVGGLAGLIGSLFVHTASTAGSSGGGGGGGMTGPVGITVLLKQQLDAGWYQYIWLTRFISLNLALMNILPIPALDGGHVFFAVIEWFRRGKRIPPEREALVHLTGFALLLTFLVVISVFDVMHLISGKGPLGG